MTGRKTHKVQLTNEFHGTAVTVQVPARIKNQYDAWLYLQEQASHGVPADRRRLARVRRALCPWRDCQCGTLRPK